MVLCVERVGPALQSRRRESFVLSATGRGDAPQIPARWVRPAHENHANALTRLQRQWSVGFEQAVHVQSLDGAHARSIARDLRALEDTPGADSVLPDTGRMWKDANALTVSNPDLFVLRESDDCDHNPGRLKDAVQHQKRPCARSTRRRTRGISVVVAADAPNRKHRTEDRHVERLGIHAPRR